MQPVIQIENVSKLYKLGFYGADTFKDEILNFWARLRGKAPVNSVVGSTNNLSSDDDTDFVWALKDINLTINEGDIVGIIGKNGSGKSTLLKLLSKITTPTTGSIKIRGRMASLLEVGTGMHPELTGRDNIFLNGAILGMTKQEIRSKFDEIVDFAGIAKYIETPIKRYSSGMRVRLGFAIAAFLEPEILVVDEVLAVGDAEFQKKAIGKMQDISSGEGRTVLFVSHNMTSVEKLCNKAFVLKEGQIKTPLCSTFDAVKSYLEEQIVIPTTHIKYRTDRNGNQDIKVINIHIKNCICNQLKQGEDIEIELEYESKLENPECEFLISINNDRQNCIIFLDSHLIDSFPKKIKSHGRVLVSLSNELCLTIGRYYINVALVSKDNQIMDHVQKAYQFDVIQGLFLQTEKVPKGRCEILVKQNWRLCYE